MKALFKIWPVMLVAIFIAYFFIDRPLCELIYRHELPQQVMSFLKSVFFLPQHTDRDSLLQHSNLISQLIDWPPLISGLSPFFLLLGLTLKPGRLKEMLILMGISVLLTFILKNDLKWVFSRYWPLTWTHNNPSWISNHVYGFQWFMGKPFQGADETGSFPSGHTAIAFAALLPIGLIYRRLLPLCLLLATLEGLAMILFDYHFLSDVLAGALLGITIVICLRSFVIRESLPVT